MMHSQKVISPPLTDLRDMSAAYSAKWHSYEGRVSPQGERELF